MKTSICTVNDIDTRDTVNPLRVALNNENQFLFASVDQLQRDRIIIASSIVEAVKIRRIGYYLCFPEQLSRIQYVATRPSRATIYPDPSIGDSSVVYSLVPNQERGLKRVIV